MTTTTTGNEPLTAPARGGCRHRRRGFPATVGAIALATMMVSFPGTVHSFATSGLVNMRRSSPSIGGRTAGGARGANLPSAARRTRAGPASPQQQSHKNLNTSRMYKNVVDEPMFLENEERASSFERRMRESFAKVGGAAAPSSPNRDTRRRSLPPNVQVVETLADYKAVVGDEKERMVVVRFHATWCRSCKAVAPSFYKLAQTYPQIKFVEVPVTEKNINLHQGLEVPSLPFGHIYHPTAGLVEEMKMSRSHFLTFRRVVRSYFDGFCEIPDTDTGSPDKSEDNTNEIVLRP